MGYKSILNLSVFVYKNVETIIARCIYSDVGI